MALSYRKLVVSGPLQSRLPPSSIQAPGTRRAAVAPDRFIPETGMGHEYLAGFPATFQRRAINSPVTLRVLGIDLTMARHVIIVAGSSIPGLIIASHLATLAKQSPALKLAVVLVAGSLPPAPRLIGGCTLRHSTLQRLAQAMNGDVTELINKLGGEQASFNGLGIGIFDYDRVDNAIALRGKPVLSSLYDQVNLSTRHGHMLEVLRGMLAADLPLYIIAGELEDGFLHPDRIKVVLNGEKHDLHLPKQKFSILNATGNARLLRTEAQLPKPSEYMLAAQVPLRYPDAADSILKSRGFAPRCVMDYGLCEAFVTPFFDPANESANAYGIVTNLVSADVFINKNGMDFFLEYLSGQLEMVRAAFNMQFVNRQSSVFAGAIPVLRMKGYELQRLLEEASHPVPVVCVNATFGVGAAAHNVDGMLGQAVGAEAYAQSLVRGIETGKDIFLSARSALKDADRALRRIRFMNRLYTWLKFHSPRLATAPMVPAFFDFLTRDFMRLGSPDKTLRKKR